MTDRFAVDYPLLHWLLTDARRITEPKAFVGALVEKLSHADIEVARLVTGIPILHPQVFSYSARWDPGKGVSERTFRVTAHYLYSRTVRPRSSTTAEGRCGAIRRRRRAKANSAYWPICAAKA